MIGIAIIAIPHKTYSPLTKKFLILCLNEKEENKNELKKNWSIDKKWMPKMKENIREKLYKGWKRSVERSLDWVE